MFIKKEIDLGHGKVITIETGKMAKQADGAVVVALGDTMVLATVVSTKTPPSPNTAKSTPRLASSPVASSSVKAVPPKKRFSPPA